jgi:hypothetical protein
MLGLILLQKTSAFYRISAATSGLSTGRKICQKEQGDSAISHVRRAAQGRLEIAQTQFALGNQFSLVATPVPEPATLAIGILSSCAFYSLPSSSIRLLLRDRLVPFVMLPCLRAL